MTPELRCYCCGEPISGPVALVTMSALPVDRVFVAKPEHLENFDEASTNALVAVPADPRPRSLSQPDDQPDRQPGY